MHKIQRKTQVYDNPPTNNSSQCAYCTKFENSSCYATEIQQSLISKYGKSGIDATESSNVDRFIEGISKVFQGGYQQFRRYYSPDTMISKYNQLSYISASITNIIISNIKNQQSTPVHYVGSHLINMHRYKRLKINCLDICKEQEVILSTSTGQQKKIMKSNHNNINNVNKHLKTNKCISKHINKHANKYTNTNTHTKTDKSNKIKPISQFRIFEINQSFELMSKLRQKIDKMCTNFNQRKRINYNKQIKSRKLSGLQKVSPNKILFPAELQKKFSKISSKNSHEKSKTKSKNKNKVIKRVYTETQQIYGLDHYYRSPKSKSLKKKSGYPFNHRCQTQMPVQNIYDSPVSRAYYPRSKMNTDKQQLHSHSPHSAKGTIIFSKKSECKKNRNVSNLSKNTNTHATSRSSGKKLQIKVINKIKHKQVSVLPKNNQKQSISHSNSKLCLTSKVNKPKHKP